MLWPVQQAGRLLGPSHDPPIPAQGEEPGPGERADTDDSETHFSSSPPGARIRAVRVVVIGSRLVGPEAGRGDVGAAADAEQVRVGAEDLVVRAAGPAVRVIRVSRPSQSSESVVRVSRAACRRRCRRFRSEDSKTIRESVIRVSHPSQSCNSGAQAPKISSWATARVSHPSQPSESAIRVIQTSRPSQQPNFDMDALGIPTIQSST